MQHIFSLGMLDEVASSTANLAGQVVSGQLLTSGLGLAKMATIGETLPEGLSMDKIGELGYQKALENIGKINTAKQLTIGAVMGLPISSQSARGTKTAIIQKLTQDRQNGLNSMSDQDIENTANWGGLIDFTGNMILSTAILPSMLGKVIPGFSANKALQEAGDISSNIINNPITGELMDKSAIYKTKGFNWLEKTGSAIENMADFPLVKHLMGGAKFGALTTLLDQSTMDFLSKRNSKDNNNSWISDLINSISYGVAQTTSESGMQSMAMGALMGGAFGSVGIGDELAMRKDFKNRIANGIDFLKKSKDPIIQIPNSDIKYTYNEC